VVISIERNGKMANIVFSDLLSRAFKIDNTIQVKSDNVLDALDELNKLYPGIKDDILVDGKNISQFIVLCKNDTVIQREDIKAVKLSDEDVLYVVNMICGG
jgi:molybdopterin converting factor small subunit